MNHILLRNILLELAPYDFFSQDKKIDIKSIEESFSTDGVNSEVILNFPIEYIGKIKIDKEYADLWNFNESEEKWYFNNTPINLFKSRCSKIRSKGESPYCIHFKMNSDGELILKSRISDLFSLLIVNVKTFPCVIEFFDYKLFKKYPKLRNSLNKAMKKFKESV